MKKTGINTVKLNRPWQVPIVIDRHSCPFAQGNLREEEILKRYHNGSWLLIKNTMSPLSFNQMLIPKDCWKREKLIRLGGLEEIIAALEIIAGEVSKIDHKYIQVGVHVGYLAGQNVTHLHYHILSPRENGNVHFIEFKIIPLPQLRAHSEKPSRTVFRHKKVNVVTGGHRAGQCYFFIDGTFDAQNFSEALYRLIMLYFEKFKSVQGAPPDYSAGLVFKDGKFQYGLTVPILNHWGLANYAALSSGGVVILPWSHEISAEHLRS